jgi:hypothetical protein
MYYLIYSWNTLSIGEMTCAKAFTNLEDLKKWETKLKKDNSFTILDICKSIPEEK